MRYSQSVYVVCPDKSVLKRFNCSGLVWSVRGTHELSLCFLGDTVRYCYLAEESIFFFIFTSSCLLWALQLFCRKQMVLFRVSGISAICIRKLFPYVWLTGEGVEFLKSENWNHPRCNRSTRGVLFFLLNCLAHGLWVLICWYQFPVFQSQHYL